MFLYILYPLNSYFSALNIFRYITFRTLLAALLSMLIVILLGKKTIALLKNKKSGIIRKHTPTTHKKKEGTPTMGGLLMILGTLISIFLAGDILNTNVIVCIIAYSLFGLLGFWDDYIKITYKDGRGIKGYSKISGQIIIALCVSLYLYYFHNDFSYISLEQKSIPLMSSEIPIPFLAGISLDLGILYIPFAVLVIIGTSNAVNITDGLDGLVTILSLQIFICFAIFAYLSGHLGIAQYLKIPFSSQIAELSVVIGALSGACLGFFWFNSHPAEIFMGDTGSLSLGGIIAILALFLKKELLLPLLGGIFVLEASSVIIQVFYYKWTKKRIFKMAPLHHHFELIGWHENKVITRFWIWGAIFTILSLASLKIR